MSCPHYTHTDREVGSYASHVCRDCTAVIIDCEHLTPVGAVVEELASSYDEIGAVDVEAAVVEIMAPIVIFEGEEPEIIEMIDEALELGGEG